MNSKIINGSKPPQGERMPTPGELLHMCLLKFDEAAGLRQMAHDAMTNPGARLDAHINGVLREATPTDAINAAQVEEMEGWKLFRMCVALAIGEIQQAQASVVVAPKKGGPA